MAVEEPLEIRLEYWQRGILHRTGVSITMRTPGQDAELAIGFLFSEGILESWNQVKQVRGCGPPVNGRLFHNIIRVEIHDGVPIDTHTLKRHSYTSSSCGICGKTSLEALAVNNPYGKAIKTLTAPVFEPKDLFGLPDRMTTRQRVFQETGGSHASGLFDDRGHLLCVREDVGRHNAMDKVLGWALINGHMPLHHHMILVSGRTSFELMQKAAMGGIPVVAAVGAPSTLAVQVAQEFNMTLIGFLRDRQFTIYHDPGRIRHVGEPTIEGPHEGATRAT